MSNFQIIILILVATFAVMFFLVKSGRLTGYWVAIDAVIIKIEPILDSVLGLDLSALLTEVQHGWLVLTATLLAGVARFRSQIKSAMGMES